jgi:hypothetical protein
MKELALTGSQRKISRNFSTGRKKVGRDFIAQNHEH